MAETAGPIDSLIADANALIKRLKKTEFKTPDDVRLELVNNTYPMIVATLENVAEVDEVVFEMSEQQESYITDELAAQIFSTIAAGGVLVELLQGVEVDDLMKKKIADAIKNFERQAELTVMAVASDDDGDDSDEEESAPSEIEEEDTAPTKPGKPPIVEPETEPEKSEQQ